MTYDSFSSVKHVTHTYFLRFNDGRHSLHSGTAMTINIECMYTDIFFSFHNCINYKNQQTLTEQSLRLTLSKQPSYLITLFYDEKLGLSLKLYVFSQNENLFHTIFKTLHRYSPKTSLNCLSSIATYTFGCIGTRLFYSMINNLLACSTSKPNFKADSDCHSLSLLEVAHNFFGRCVWLIYFC